MAEPENLIARLIPGDLENQIPAAVKKVLPGGFKNRMIQAGLALLIAFGLSFVVKRLIDLREARTRPAIPPAPAAPALPPAVAPAAAAPLPLAAAAPDPAPVPLAEPVPAPPAPPAPAAAAETLALLGEPHVSLSGSVDQAMYAAFRAQIAAAPREGPLVIALSSHGGDVEVARLMADELRLLRDYGARELLFLGKVAVHAAGTAFMAAFPPADRFLTRGTRLLIQEGSADAHVAFAGPLRGVADALRARLNEIELAARAEEEGFRALAAGTRVAPEELRRRAAAGWFLDADEARALGIVADVI
ncbi:ATP-dependent Clp protease proteolytic subunit [Sphingomonas canadensis]|uniref:ATP-dependent Clp protease proteolytic subunit n=1 Tax=Sphingomonas canadensis TaxID=1219257 RepID=A0ABW3H238_9SPHN